MYVVEELVGAGPGGMHGVKGAEAVAGPVTIHSVGGDVEAVGDATLPLVPGEPEPGGHALRSHDIFRLHRCHLQNNY